MHQLPPVRRPGRLRHAHPRNRRTGRPNTLTGAFVLASGRTTLLQTTNDTGNGPSQRAAAARSRSERAVPVLQDPQSGTQYGHNIQKPPRLQMASGSRWIAATCRGLRWRRATLQRGSAHQKKERGRPPWSPPLVARISRPVRQVYSCSDRLTSSYWAA